MLYENSVINYFERSEIGEKLDTSIKQIAHASFKCKALYRVYSSWISFKDPELHWGSVS